MSLTSFLESIKSNETDNAEGCLLLCESDLISSFLVSHYAASATAASAHTTEAPGLLLSQKGKVNTGAC